MADIKKIVQLQDENGLFIYPTTTLEAIAGSNTLRDNFVQKIGDTMSGPLQATGFIGPLTGNATSADKLNTDKGSASNPVYFLNGIPVACTGTTVPTGGSAGQVLIKKSDGGIEWKELVALPKGGAAGQVLVKSSATNGDASWSTDINGNAATATTAITATTATKAVQDGNGNTITSTYLPLTGGTVSGTVTTSGEIISTNVHPLRSVYGSYGLIQRNDGDRYWFLPTAEGDPYGTWANTSVSIQLSNGALYGAVWNDYAEFRNQKEVIKPGYCVASADNGEVYRTTEKFQACDGIVSDTYGFAIGETDECKTPLAVAGRVLAYYSGNREDYHAGDTVCAGPEGKVCKMTREEIREWPDRIIGIVSEIPEYKTWGSGNVKVNNRIWIKVK